PFLFSLPAPRRFAFHPELLNSRVTLFDAVTRNKKMIFGRFISVAHFSSIEFSISSMASRAESVSYTAVEVIDPVNRTGKMVVPRQHISQETRGLLDHLVAEKTGQWARCNRTVRDLSLCLLFVKGRCHAGARCNQVHVDAPYVEEKRSQALASA